MWQVKRFARAIVSLSLIALLTVPLMPYGHSANAGERRASSPTQSGIVTGQSRPDQKSSAQLTWKSEGTFQNGQLQIRDAAINLSRLDKDGSPIHEARSEPGEPGTANLSGFMPSVAATASRSIMVSVSPPTGPPESEVVVSGRVPADVQLSTVRVLFQFNDDQRRSLFTRGLAEISVGRDGRFSAPVTIPADAPGRPAPGIPHEIMVVGGDDSNTVEGRGNYNVIQVRQPGRISGTVSVDLGDGTTQPVVGAPVVLNFTVFQGGTPQFLGIADTTNSQGKYDFPEIDARDYGVTVSHPAIIFPPQTASLQPGQHLIINFVGMFASPGIAGCEQWKATYESQGQHIYVSSQFHKPGPSSGANIGTFVSMPNKGVPFLNRFAAVIPFAVSSQDNVKITVGNFKFPATLMTGQFFSSYVAEVDMSQLPPGQYQVGASIETTQDGEPFECELAPGLGFTVIQVPWFNCWVDNPNVQVVKTNPTRYEFSGTLPNPSFNFNEPLDLDFVQLDNIVQLGIPIHETLRLDGTWQGTAKAEAQVTFLSLDFLNESLPYNPSGGPFLNHSYTLPTFSEQLFDECVKVFEYGWGIPDVLFVGISASFCVGAAISLDSMILQNLKVNATVTPQASLGVKFAIEVDLLVCGAEVSVKPQATVQLPIACQLSGSCPGSFPDCGFQSPCLKVDAVFSYEVECFWVDVSSGSETVNLFEVGCGSSNRSLAEAMTASARRVTPTAATSVNTLARLQPRPSVATDGGGHALAVWVREETPAPTPLPTRRIVYSLYNGRVWSEPAPIYSGNPMVEAPQVVFLGPNRALAVWRQSKLSLPQALSSDEPTLTHSSELYYAVWDGQTWSAPAALTDDQVVDARPSLAANPATGQAMLVWIRGDQLAEEQPSGLSYARFNGTQWSQPLPLVQRGQAVDYQHGVRFNRLGQPAAVWLRDLDGDLFTRADRQILFSQFNGAGWNPPEPLPDLPPGPYSPSLDFDNSNNPVVAFVVASVDQKPTESLGTGDGNRSLLYAAYRRGNRWEVAPVGEATAAERPVVRVTADNQAIIMYRQFGDKFDTHTSGDLASAVADLNGSTLSWTTGFLTNDGLTNWQVAFDMDRSTSRPFVVNVKPAPDAEDAEKLSRMPRGEIVGGDIAFRGFPSANLAVTSAVVPYAADLSLNNLVVSDPHPLVGDTVMITANVRNAGLKPVPAGAALTVRFYEGEATHPNFIGEQRITRPLAFNTATPVSVPLTIRQGGLRNLTAVVDPEGIVQESDLSNNTARAILGRPTSPLQLFGNSDPARRVISLGWTSSETRGIAQYRVFRSQTPGAGYELVGTTVNTDFIDTLVRPGVRYYYVVQTVDVYGTRSPFSNEASAQLAAGIPG